MMAGIALLIAPVFKGHSRILEALSKANGVGNQMELKHELLEYL